MTYRPFGLVMALLVVQSLSASQTWQPPRTPDGQPDMQGIWRADNIPAAAVNLEGINHPFLQLEYKLGNAGDGPFRVPRTYIIDPPDGTIPYQPWALEKRKTFQANLLAPTKREHIDPHSRAWSDGVPRVNAWGELQILQSPGYVLFTYSYNHQYRIIPLDGRPHLDHRIRLFNGDSRGSWDGNTLVIDTTNQTDRTWLDHLNFHGADLHVVERWTFTSQDHIDYRATYDDPSTFTRPWTIAFGFNRNTDPTFELWEEASYEGERDTALTLPGGGVRGQREK